MSDTFIIVGGGHAGVRAIDCLRRADFDGRIELVSADPHLPDHRPPLCKKFLRGQTPLERMYLRHEPHFARHNAVLRLGTQVEAIDPEARAVQLAGGENLSYDKLLLCLGARARRLDVPGSGLQGVHYLRSYDDAAAIQAGFTAGRRLVVVGAGYIGLELAATACELGLSVTVLELAERALARVVAPVVSAFFARRHAQAGVELVCNARVREFRGAARVRSVVTADGREFPAELVVVGVGNQPETALAQAAGLACENGILVDAHCRTSDPDIYAAGDCTRHPSVHFGGKVRLESVDNALEQARVAAANMCGQPLRHAHVPWFWSDQYDIKLQIAGLSGGHDQLVVRGDPAGSGFSVWYLRRAEVLSVEAVNRPADFMQGGKWIAERRRVDPARLGDPGVALAAV
ncbi:MAG: FAD-dependent oxidoreductase [Burkholderiales bacterium]|nr:FAD-dependent oxidoreductase [Burkholderiales bacterium]